MAGISNKAAGLLTNKYQYNGKEKQSNEFSDGSGLEWNDFGARLFDPQIGRWHVIDSKSELYHPFSTYQFCLNNPIKYYDSDGRIIRDKDGNIVFVPIGGLVTKTHDGTKEITVGTDGYIFADDNTKIRVFKNLANNTEGFDTDCHGVTFADGLYWIDNDQVQTIIDHDNGYRNIDYEKEEVKKGDVVLYIRKNDEGEDEVADSKTVFSKKNKNFDDIIVYGQGGLEKENSKKKIKEAWPGKANIVIFRKEGKDKVLTDEEIEERKKTTSSFKSSARLKAENN